MNADVFSARESLKFLGMHVQSLDDLAGAPSGTHGRVIAVCLGRIPEPEFSLTVLWDLEKQPVRREFSKREFKRLLSVASDEPSSPVSS